MNRIVLACIGMLTAMTAMAQSGMVKGRVLDKQTDEVLQFVNVTIADANTGKMVKGAITDIKGAFSIGGLADGSYLMTVSFVGYKSATKKFVLDKENRQQNYPAIYIGEDSQLLREVEVTGQRSQMKLEVDRKTFSVDQIISAAGGSASDLLENIPSVEVTTDGEISLRGNSSVEVWINGKASGLTSDNRGEILQQIPAESIERIEVIDNPSAKFSAEGSAGIINIVLKQDRKAGYYGSLRAGVQDSWGWNAGGNINYSSKWIDAFGNIGWRQHRGGGGSKSDQTYLSTNTYQRYNTDSEDNGHNLFARAGITVHATGKDDLGLSGMTMMGKRDNTSLTPYHYGTVGEAQDSYIMYRDLKSGGDMNMINLEVDYTHNFAEKHKLDLSVTFDKWKNDDDNWYKDSTQYIETGAATDYTYQYRPNHIRNRSWEVKLDYENQITDNLKIEAGYNGKFAHENTPQESYIDEENWDGANQVEETEYYNRFIYDNDIHALYATANAKMGKLGVMAGLRAEYWRVDTESYDWEQEHDPSTRDEAFKKDYFELFPSLFLNYQFTESAQIQLNYTRRLRRPRGGELNSFKNTRDASIISFGNPELTPEFTHSISLNFLKSWDEHTLSVGAYYRPTTDVIQKINYEDDGMMYQTSMNVAKSQSSGIEVIGKNKLFRILDLTTTLNAYYYKLDGFSFDINDQTVTGDSEESFSWDARILASLILPYDISAQGTLNYRSRQAISQGYKRSNTSFDLGVRKSLFNKLLTLSVNWRDVFKTRKWRNHTYSDSFDRYQENWKDPRFNFVVSWNFGNISSKKNKNNSDISSEDLNGDYDSGEY